MSVIDQLHQGVTWRDVRLVREDIVKDFFLEFIPHRIAQTRTIGKYITALQNFVTYVEKGDLIVKNLPDVKSGIASQAETRRNIVEENIHEIDPHDDIPIRVLSLDEENRVYSVALEYNNNNILTFEESMLFLVVYTNTKTRLIRGETLMKRKFCDLYVNCKEGPHRQWAKSTLIKNTGQDIFENAVYLLNQPYGAKVKKEKKTMTGAYRHYDLFRCSIFYMAVTYMLYVDKTRESVFNFYVDKSKGDTCKLN